MSVFFEDPTFGWDEIRARMDDFRELTDEDRKEFDLPGFEARILRGFAERISDSVEYGLDDDDDLEDKIDFETDWTLLLIEEKRSVKIHAVTYVEMMGKTICREHVLTENGQWAPVWA